MSTLTPVTTLEGHTDRVWCTAWSPDGAHSNGSRSVLLCSCNYQSCECTGAYLASCSGDKTVRIWQRLADPRPPWWHCCTILEDAHTKTIRSVNWSPGGDSLVTASFDGSTVVWRKASSGWAQVAILEGHENEVKAAVFSPCSSLLATCGRDKTVWIWESFPGDDFECVDVKQGHTQDVKMVAWQPGDNKVLVSVSYDNSIKVWKEDPDGSEWYCAQTLEGIRLGHDSTVWAISFSPNGDFFATVSEDTTLKVWFCSERDGQPLYKLVSTSSGHHSRPVYGVSWGKDAFIATACGDNSVKIFHFDGEQCNLLHAQHKAHLQDVNCVAWHPTDSGTLASCSDDGSIRIWKFHADPDLGLGS